MRLEACTAPDPVPYNLEVVEKAKVVESVAAESKMVAVVTVTGTVKRLSWWRAVLAASWSLPVALP